MKDRRIGGRREGEGWGGGGASVLKEEESSNISECWSSAQPSTWNGTLWDHRVARDRFWKSLRDKQITTRTTVQQYT